MVKAIGVGWPSFIGKCRSIFLGYSHQSLTGRFGTHQASMKWVIQFLSPTHGFGSSYCIPGIATHLKVNCFFFLLSKSRNYTGTVDHTFKFCTHRAKIVITMHIETKTSQTSVFFCFYTKHHFYR